MGEDDYTFNTASEWESHVRAHGDLASSSRSPILSKLSERLSLPLVSCPLCRQPEGPLSLEEDDHIAGHLHSLALRSLPWVETGDSLQTNSRDASIVSGDYLPENDLDSDSNVGDDIIIINHGFMHTKVLFHHCVDLLRNVEGPQENTPVWNLEHNRLLTSLEQAVRDMDTISSISDAQNEIFFASVNRLRIRLLEMARNVSQDILHQALEDLAPILELASPNRDSEPFSVPSDVKSLVNDQKSIYSGQSTGLGRPRTKIVVGIDFGSQYTGVSYGWSGESLDETIIAFTHWPTVGSQDIEAPKVPTQIAYETDRTAISWGYLIQPGASRCGWMSLLLDKNAPITEHDDLRLHEALLEIERQLPPGKSVEIVIEDFLRGLYTFIMSMLQNDYPDGITDLTPIDFWLTVPAIWSYQAQIKTLRAATKAFSLIDGEELSVISELEAGAIAMLVDGSRKLNMRLGDEFLVFNCGDSTVDWAAYRVLNDDPWELNEIIAGGGGKFGAISLEHNLRQLASRLFGEKFDSLPLSLTGPSSQMMQDFEWNKQRFGTPCTKLKTLRLSMDMPNSAAYNQLDAEIILTESDMEAIFDPVIERIIKLIDRQVKSRHWSNPGPRIPVRNSPYIRSRLREWCMKNRIHMDVSVENWEAATGAVVRGLELATIRQRLSRQHYDLQMDILYNAKKHGQRSDVFTDPFTGTTYAPGYMGWSIARGTAFAPNESRSLRFFQVISNEERVWYVEIKSCSLEEPPQWYNSKDVEDTAMIEGDLTGVDYSRFGKQTIDGIIH